MSPWGGGVHFRQMAKYLKGAEEEGRRRERRSGGETAHKLFGEPGSGGQDCTICVCTGRWKEGAGKEGRLKRSSRRPHIPTYPAVGFGLCGVGKNATDDSLWKF